MKIKHVINIIDLDEISKNSDLHICQPIAIESIRRARNRAIENGYDVEVTAVYQTENTLRFIPDEFDHKKKLGRSILDFGDFKNKRDLPLIGDVLDLGKDGLSDDDYVIYTNVDIILRYDFYERVYELINEKGLNNFSINRRTVSKNFTKVEELNQIYKKEGQKHPGHDCFIFKKQLLDKFKLGKTIIGGNHIGKVIISNFIKLNGKHTVFTNEKLTFHIGNDGEWKNKKKSSEFNKFNNEEYKRLKLPFVNKNKNKINYINKRLK